MSPIVSRTLTGQTLSRLALGGAAILLLTSAVSTWVLYRQVEDHATERLALQALERARVAERVLAQTVESHEVVRRAFVEKWPQYQDAATLRRFDQLFVRYPDGAIRNRPEINDGRKWSTGWIRKGEPLSEELRRRFVLFFDLSQQYGPGMVVRAANLYFMSYPEQSNMGYDPILSPDWILTIPPDFDQTAYDWGRIAYLPASVGMPSLWSAPELDISGGQTVHSLSVSTVIHYQGRQLASVNSGTGLPDLLAKIYGHGQGDSAGRMVLLREDGRLIHDPQGGDELNKVRPQASQPLHMAILSKARSASRFPVVEYDEAEDNYFAIAPIEGPGWLVATVLPGKVVRAEALSQAQWALWTGIVALVLLLAVFATVLRRRIAGPLGELTRAAERVASGVADVRLPVGRSDELGRLAQAFNHMASKVAERDATLRQDKQEIETALAHVRRTEERWRAMTENASDLIVVLADDGRIAYASPSVGKMLGVEGETLIGRDAVGFVHPEDQARLRPLIAQPTTLPVRYRGRDASGAWRELEAIASDLRGLPAVGGLVFNIRDITAQVRAEEEVSRQREALHQSEKLSALGGLLAGVAHELNNPLAVVVGRSIQLEGVLPDPAQRETAGKIRAAAERCTRIVKTFLAMARQQAPKREATALNDVILSALDVVGYSLRAGGVEVDSRLQADLPRVLADADQLGQVFLNLFTNALHAMTGQDGARRLTLRSWHADGMAHVEVADTGPGIPADIRTRIFEPFFTTKGVGEGTGVGLSVSLGILQSHGGSLTLADAAGGGARFIVSLPVPGAMTEQDSGISVTAGSASAHRGLRILVVDDEVEIAEVLRDILVPAGHTVAIVGDGGEALACLAEGGFDLVFTDLKMPDMDGLALCREIIAHHPKLADRVVIVTGDTLGGAARRFLDDTGLPVVDKPFTPAAILEMAGRFKRGM